MRREVLPSLSLHEINIVVTGGGTAGHLFPAIALAEELTKRGYSLHLITDIRCAKYLTDDLKLIPHVLNFRLPAGGIYNKIKFLISLLIATYQSLSILVRSKPSAIIGFGGYPTFPPLLVSILLRIPIIIYEQNCFIGKTNRFFLKFARKIALTYEETKNGDLLPGSKKLVIGNILRTSIKQQKINHDFNHDVFRIFIFGGSQSAKIFSQLIPETMKILVKLNPTLKIAITQQAVNEEHDNIAKVYNKLKIPYKLAEFFYDMEKQYANHELVISRAGASTIAELSYVGMPAIFIPLPTAAENHQYYNAKAMENRGAGWCYEQNKISPAKLAEKILALAEDRDILRRASFVLLGSKSDGSKVLASEIEEIIG